MEVDDKRGAERYVEILGEEAARLLIEKYGGQVIYIPIKPTSSMIDHLGEAVAKAVCDNFGRYRLRVPSRFVKITERNAEIIEARANGATIRQLSERFELTERQIFYVLSPGNE